MGVLSDLVVAPAEDAERVAHASVPSREFGGIDIKGVDTVKFGTLHSLVTGRTFDEVLPLYDPVAEVSEDGPWVFRIPEELVLRLAALSDEERRTVAVKWAATEEFALSGWEEAAVSDGLVAICELARRATDAGHALFLWMCL